MEAVIGNLSVSIGPIGRIGPITTPNDQLINGNGK
jgi:hypothetical protein